MISTSVAQQRPQSGASFEITPYLWAAGTDADVTVGGQTVAVKRDFSDIVENADVGGDLLTVARFGRFVLYGQLDFLSLNTSELDNQPAGGELDIDFQTTTIAMGVQLNGRKPGQTYDLLFGAREVSIEPEFIRNAPPATFRGERELTDPLIMFRPTTPFGKRWKFTSTFSYGEGDSEKTYEMWPQFQLQLSDKVAARFGYRRLFYDIAPENTLNAWDGSLQGITIGIGGTFGGPRPPPPAPPAPPAPPPQPAPAAAPAPPPPPPDADRDGVVDARDQCADTRAGERVDAIGCSYEMRLNVLFGHDSSTLNPQSTGDLERVVELLTRVTTISGVIEGHSDSSGAAEYNQALSERRAQAVMAYLVGRGISQSRLRAAGFGESQPIADNGTDAGRAENRRVVLRRSDAPR